jgi:exopolysaccharide biosynthesis polyprenyl glycosylphosphotransferase
MSTPQRRIIPTLLKIVDLAVVGAAFVGAACLTRPAANDWLPILELRISVGTILFFLAYLGFWHFVLRTLELYSSYRLSPSSREWRNLGLATLIGVLPLPVLRDVLGLTYANGMFFAAFTVAAFLGLGTERRLFRGLARSMRRHGRNLRQVVIIGDSDSAFDMASRIVRRADLGYRILDLVDAAAEPGGSTGPGPCTAVSTLADVIAQQPIDEVFVALPLDTAQSLIRAVIALCEEQGITVRILSSINDPLLGRAHVDELDGRPVITVLTGPPDSLSLLAKRLLDVFVSLAGLILLTPVFVLLAVAIKLDSRGPVLFIQERIGFNRRRFRAYKFRTMVPEAEQQQAALEPRNEADGPVFKIRDDPRITPLGRWLRRLSLDEMPQLLNVLQGDMSLVGPRPLPVRDVSRIDIPAHKRRFSVKPGITCLWQVNGREPRFDKWVKADMEYIDNWSFVLDLKILLKTIPAVLSGRGAC